MFDARYSTRTHVCGQLRAANVGDEVVLAGWVHRRRDHGGLIFIDLRDRSGLVQCTFSPEVRRDLRHGRAGAPRVGRSRSRAPCALGPRAR